MRTLVRWRGLYQGQSDIWSDESYAHPAKMAPALAFRILEHLEEKGLLRPSDTVLDFMGGIGTTVLAAALKGYPATMIELEPRFIGLANANKERLERKLGRPLDITIIQGDARQMATLLKERGMVGVVSPPYADATQTLGETKGFHSYDENEAKNRQKRDYIQGSSPGQIGALPDKPRLVAVTSPPYHQNGNAVPPRASDGRDAGVKAQFQRGLGWRTGQKYGTEVGQIGALPDKPRVAGIVSPPYLEAQSGGGISAAKRGEGHYAVTTRMPGSIYQPSEHGSTPGQIGSLPDKPRDSTRIILNGTDLSWEDRWPEQDLVGSVVSLHGVDAVESVTFDNPIPLSIVLNATGKSLRSYAVDPGQLSKVRKMLIGKAEIAAGVEMVGELFTLRLKNGMAGIVVSVGKVHPLNWLLIISSLGKMEDLLRLITLSRSVRRATIVPTELGIVDTWLSVRSAAQSTKAALLVLGPVHHHVEQNSIQQSITDGVKRPDATEGYSDAMLQVYQAAYQVCDVLAVVTKNPTRGGKLRRLDKDTLALLKEARWRPACYHQALLFEEDQRVDLFGETTRRPRGRLGFFKRLQYQRGAPVADHEDVFVCIKDAL